MKKLDVLTPIGIIVGLVVITIAIISTAGLSDALTFLDFVSFLVVFGGLAGSLLINFSPADVKNMFKVMKQSFITQENQLEKLIPVIEALALKARREGLLALEKDVEELEDPFIQRGIMLAIDGIEPELIKDILMAEVLATEERHTRGRQIIERAGELAPAWGMIGTVVGLILMLQTLQDASSLGPKMAIALITTFYGAVLANLVFIPLAGKLANKSEQELFLKEIIIEGILGVQSGQNPKLLEEKLSAFLPVESRSASKRLTRREGVIADEV